MTNLSRITIPFGLLDKEDQKALKNYEGKIEFFSNKETWELSSFPLWVPSITYRAEPDPVQDLIDAAKAFLDGTSVTIGKVQNLKEVISAVEETR